MRAFNVTLGIPEGARNHVTQTQELEYAEARASIHGAKSGELVNFVKVKDGLIDPPTCTLQRTSHNEPDECETSGSPEESSSGVTYTPESEHAETFRGAILGDFLNSD